MIRAIRKHAGDFFLIVGVVAAAAGCGAYILAHQRLRFPWEATPLTLKASFATAQAVTPGQGQTVRVSGVRIGDIARVDLKDGRGIVTMDVDPEYAGMIHTDASALLRPKTGLKDMFLELQPGTSRAPVVKDGFTIPIANTLPDINPDEFYGALDRDTRDYLKLLVDGAGQGLKGRGADLRDLLRRFEPTHRDLARFTTAVNERRENLRRLIHNLNVLNGELAGKSTDLTELVDTSSHVFRAFAREQGGITRAVDLLPGALRQTTSTLGKVETFARILGPATRDLSPVGPALNKANKAALPLGKEATPIIRTEIRPFVRDFRPLVRDLKPASNNLADATPQLTRSFTVLNHLFNLVAFNPDGREDPSKANRDEGYLFWLAWLNHNGASAFSNSDANGTFRPVTLVSTCETLKESVAETPLAAFITGFTNVMTDAGVCGAH
ncbi:MAG: MCE family protein [Actinobacteria bacterium]|nr:MAG: MCE family protein [Actinomycetota bacterium]